MDNKNIKEQSTQSAAPLTYTPITISMAPTPWTRKEASGRPDVLFLFTDNTDRDSGKGIIDRNSPYYKQYGDGEHDLHYPTVTAAVLRGLPNAMPVSTQRWYHEGAKGEAGRWNDADVSEFALTLQSEFDNILTEIAFNPDIKTVMLPGSDGFFNGKISAITKERTPELYKVMESMQKYLTKGVERINEMRKEAPEFFALSREAKEAILKSDVFQSVWMETPETLTFEHLTIFNDDVPLQSIKVEHPEFFPAQPQEEQPVPKVEQEAVSQENKEFIPKVFVSHFSSRGIPDDAMKVSIATRAPETMGPVVEFPELKPSWRTMVAPHKEGAIDNAEYSRRYQKDVLERYEPQILGRMNTLLSEAKEKKQDIYLLCYEGPGKFCHRYLAANFLNEKGIAVDELPFDRQRYEVGAVPLLFEKGIRLEAPQVAAPEEKREIVFRQIRFTVSEGAYKQRTVENANAEDVDFTFQFAVDFTTPGERATVTAAGDKLIRADINTLDGMSFGSPEHVEAVVRQILSTLPKDVIEGKPIGVNIAGNGITTMAARGITQEMCDDLLVCVFTSLKHHGINVRSLRSGGQTGIDESGMAVSLAMDIPMTVHAPRGWAYRIVDENAPRGYRDISDQESFIGRASKKDYEGLRFLSWNYQKGLEASASQLEGMEAPASVKEEKDMRDGASARSLATYSNMEIVNILDTVHFPDRGKNADFDMAADILSAAMPRGWTTGLSEKDIRAKLMSTILSLPQAVREYIESEASGITRSSSIFSEKPCDVYTLGFSTRTQDDFFAAIPPQTKIIIDIRPQTSNKFQPWSNKSALSTTLGQMGFRYVHISLNKPDAFASIRALVDENPGSVLIASGKNKPTEVGKPSKKDEPMQPGHFGVGLQLGPYLESVGHTVGHISTRFNQQTKIWEHKPSVLTQEELTHSLLELEGLQIKNGSYRSISFDENKRHIIAKDSGVVLEKVVRLERDTRTLGKPDYGVPIPVFKSEFMQPVEVMQENAENSHVTILFTMMKKKATGYERTCVLGAKEGYVSIHMPNDPERLRSMAYARKAVREEVYDPLARRLLAMQQKAEASGGEFDAQSIIANIVGEREPYLLNRISDTGAATEEELRLSSLNDPLAKEAFSMGMRVVSRGDAQMEDYQVFVTNVLRAIGELSDNYGKDIEDYDQRYAIPWRITKVLNTGETGVQECALHAAQELGLSPMIHTTPKYPYTYDNGTARGYVVSGDKLSFTSRFYQGKKKKMTRDEMLLQIDHVAKMGVVGTISGEGLAEAEGNARIGLTDLHVLTLQNLGYSNDEILRIIDISTQMKMRVPESPYMGEDEKPYMSSKESLMRLLEDISANELPGQKNAIVILPELTLETVHAAEQKAREAIAEARKEGYGIITAANPLYPLPLRLFEGQVNDRFTDTTIDVSQPEEGLASASVLVNTDTVQKEIERPAILYFAGDIYRSMSETLSVISNPRSELWVHQQANKVGEKCAEAGITVVTAMREPIVKKHTHHITAKEIVGGEYRSFDEEGEAYRNRATLVNRDDAMTSVRNTAMEKGGGVIVFSADALDCELVRDDVKRITEAGGLVFSLTPPGGGAGSSEAYTAAGLYSAAMGNEALVLDSKASDFEISAINEARHALDEVFVINYGKQMFDEHSIAGNEKMLRAGARPVGTEEELAECIRSAHFSNNEFRLDAKQEDQAEKVEQAREEAAMEKHVDNYDFSVLRKGTEQVFIVPANYPDVRDAIRQQYGKDVVFADNYGIAHRNLEYHEVTVDGKPVYPFMDDKTTRIAEDAVYSAPLFYRKGNIYSISNAPQGTRGLASLKEREANMKLMKQFIKDAGDIINKFNAELAPKGKFMEQVKVNEDGKETTKAVESERSYPQLGLQFENAFWARTTEMSLEVFKGSEIVASVSINTTLNGKGKNRKKGSIRTQNIPLLGEDLEEYGKRSPKLFPVPEFMSCVDGPSKAEVEGYLNICLTRLDAILNGKQLDENEEYQLATREERAAIDEELAQGFRKLAEDNLSVATTDIVNAINAGILAEPTTEEVDRAKAFAALEAEQNGLTNDTKQLPHFKKLLRSEEEKLSGLRTAYDNAVTNSLSEDEFNKLREDIEDVETKVAGLEETIRDIRRRIAVLEVQKERIAMSDHIYLSSDKKGSMVLYVGGAAVDVNKKYIGKISREEAQKKMDAFREDKLKQQKAFLAGVERNENYSATLEDAGRIHDARFESVFGKAHTSEIIPGSLSNGRYVIERDGKQAYCDENMNIRSSFYDSCGKWRGHIGPVILDGKHNFISPEDKPVMAVWADQFCKGASEGTKVIKVGEEYGVIDSDGALIGERFFQNAHLSSEGFCLVQGTVTDGEEKAGKFNFINKENGKFLSRLWFDKAGDFKDGLASIAKGNRVGTIDRDGKITWGIKRDGPGGH